MDRAFGAYSVGRPHGRSFPYYYVERRGRLVCDSFVCIAPPHWAGELGYGIDSPTGFVWHITDPGPAPPDWIDKGANTYGSRYGADPGEVLSGFSLITDAPPTNVKYTVLVWYDMEPAPAGTAGVTNPCGFFDEGTTGIIVGPWAPR